jgi:TRAP-type C4-dicarboxylate transport system substrate-binding protein
MQISSLVLCAVLVAALPAGAEPTTLRLATAAPDGTAWARLFKGMALDVAAESNGELALKWYFGSIAGNEMEMLDRMKRGQLDGVLSGGILCMRLAPTMRVLRLLTLFQSRDEASYVIGRLRPILDAEFIQSGYQNMAEGGLGSDILFTRTPVRTLAELRKTRLWVWDLDEPMRAQLKALGVPIVPLPVEEASRAYEEHRVDGFLAVPAAALAFQWSAQTKYMSQIHMAFLTGCLIVTNRAFDALPITARRALQTSTAKLSARIEDLGHAQDDELVNRLFAKQGLETVPLIDPFSAEFFDAARYVRDHLPNGFIPTELIQRVMALLADYRAEHVMRRADAPPK